MSRIAALAALVLLCSHALADSAAATRLGALLAGMQRIEAGHDPNNPASGAVLRKCGLQYEGILRKRIRSNQGITDVAWYSILKEEWKK